MARRTEQQAQETREQILNAAIRIFSISGVSSTTLTDIASSAGVSRGAIYWHFKNKADLFNEIWKSSKSKLCVLEKTYQGKLTDNPLLILRETLVHQLITTANDHYRRDLLEIAFHKCEFTGEMMPFRDVRKVLDLENHEFIEHLLDASKHRGQLPENLNTRLAAIMLRAYLTGLMENWLFMPESFSLNNEADILIDMFLGMIQSSPLCIMRG